MVGRPCLRQHLQKQNRGKERKKDGDRGNVNSSNTSVFWTTIHYMHAAFTHCLPYSHVVVVQRHWAHIYDWAPWSRLNGGVVVSWCKKVVRWKLALLFFQYFSATVHWSTWTIVAYGNSCASSKASFTVLNETAPYPSSGWKCIHSSLPVLTFA